MNMGALLVKSAYYQNADITNEKKYTGKCETILKKRDSVEISAEAYRRQSDEEQMSAASGKDTLGITRGSRENTYVIHFSDSAMVSRTISRGYLTVNGIRINLSDEVKEQLTEADRQAEADRMRAYNEYVMQHEMAVAKQQGETYQKLAQDTSKAFEIAAKISNGGKGSSSEEKKLMQFNPQLYAMAKSAATMAKHPNEPDKVHRKENESDSKEKNGAVQGVDWSQFEWKTYESQMTVSLEDKGEVQGVSEGRVGGRYAADCSL